MARWIVRDFERPDPELLASFKDLPSSILSDCMNRFQAMDGGIQALSPGRPLLGSAITVQAMESSNWGAHQALALAKPGDVLVIAARGGMMNAVWGYVMTHSAMKRGLAGIVIDGCIRDATENREPGWPIYCRGVAPGGPHKGWQENINVPVACAGTVVQPGDIIVADDDGVVVVPLARAKAVLAEAYDRLTIEEEWLRRIDDGETTADILGLPPPE